MVTDEHGGSACSASGSYKCQFCDKKFKGEAFLVKHINNKHKDEFDMFKDDARNKVRSKPAFLNHSS